MYATRTTASTTPFEPHDLTGLLTELAVTPTLWLRQAHFEPSGRWWRRLVHNDDVDIWLLTWLTGHSTDLHDHGGSAGAFIVLQGALTEVRVGPDQLSIATTTVPRGDSIEIPPNAIHDVYNAGQTPAISLHAYSPPLAQMNFYAQDPTGITRLSSTETRAESLDAA